MGRPPINISVLVSSTQDNRFVKSKIFFSIPEVSKAMGISLRAVRNLYHSKGTSIRKASGKVYTLKWYEPYIPLDTSRCYHCRNALTVKNRSAWFDLEREDIKEASMNFTSLYMASKKTGISINALRNACEKSNKKITRRKGEFARYKISSFSVCCQCDPSSSKKSKDVIVDYVFPR